MNGLYNLLVGKNQVLIMGSFQLKHLEVEKTFEKLIKLIYGDKMKPCTKVKLINGEAEGREKSGKLGRIKCVEIKFKAF